MACEAPPARRSLNCRRSPQSPLRSGTQACRSPLPHQSIPPRGESRDGRQRRGTVGTAIAVLLARSREVDDRDRALPDPAGGARSDVAFRDRTDDIAVEALRHVLSTSESARAALFDIVNAGGVQVPHHRRAGRRAGKGRVGTPSLRSLILDARMVLPGSRRRPSCTTGTGSTAQARVSPELESRVETPTWQRARSQGPG